MIFIKRKRICVDCQGQGCHYCNYNGTEVVIVGHIFVEDEGMFYPVFPHDFMDPVLEEEFNKVYEEDGIYED